MEAQLIGQVTARLRRAAMNAADFPTLVAALHANKQMWDTLAVSVADKDNTLPQALRAQIFYLAEFTTHHSRKIMRGQDTVTPLIEINTAVLRGLNGEGST
jgi:flagellar protein FlaF